MDLNVAELEVTEKLNGFSPLWLENEGFFFFLQENTGKHNSIITHLAAFTIAIDGMQQVFSLYRVCLCGSSHIT